MSEPLGIIADIHGNSWALEAVLRDATRRGIKRFMNLGDVYYGPLDPAGVFALLQTIEVVAEVAGNQDRQLLEATEADVKANPTLAFTLEEVKRAGAWPHVQSLLATARYGDFFLCHGTPTSDTTYWLEDISSGVAALGDSGHAYFHRMGLRCRVALCGHTHVPRVLQLDDGMIVNPGSVGLQAYEDTNPRYHIMETGSPHARYAVIRDSDVDFVAVAYDPTEAMTAARRLNRGDWAWALQTGRVARPIPAPGTVDAVSSPPATTSCRGTS